LKAVKSAILTLYNVAGHETLSAATVQLYLNDNVEDDRTTSVKNRRGKISGRGKSQQQYLEQISTNDLTLGVGPAGGRSAGE